MWSVGAILFELLNGYPPFHGRSNVQVSHYLPQNGKFLLKFLCSFSQLKTWFFFLFFFLFQILKTIKESKCLPFSPLISDQLPSHCIDMCSRLLSIFPGVGISPSYVKYFLINGSDFVSSLSVCREKIVLWCVLWSWLFEERGHKDLKLNKTSSWLQS